jgi:hypothetical protein
MKKHQVLTISLLVAITFGCKKSETVKNSALITESSAADYSMPDTTNPVAGNYFIKFKESFILPYASVYKGDFNDVAAKVNGATIYEREAKAAVLKQLSNADGSAIISANSIKGFVSNLVVGFQAYLDAETLRKVVANPQVEAVELQVLRRVIETPESTKEATKVLAPQGQIVDALRSSIGFKDASLNKKHCWIMDSGIDPTHPDLRSDVALAKNFSTSLYNFDVSGHGTQVAGVMGARNNAIGTRGVAAGANIASIKVINDLGESTPATITSGLNHIWLYSIAGDVVNMSLSWAVADGGYSTMETALRKFKNYKIYFAVAAGNQYADAKIRTPGRMSSTSYLYNSDMLGWFFTMASYKTNFVFATDYLPYYSGGSNYGSSIDYATAGYGIYSTTAKGGYISNLAGTSLSAPIVAGMLLLNNGVIWSQKYTSIEPKSNLKYKVASLYP